jgi:hypothetical protein
VVELRAATIADVYALAARLRDADRAEVEAAGMSVRAAIRRCFRSGVLCSTAFVDGEIACMWGLAGTMISDVGHPFLMTTPMVERAPIALIKIGKMEVAKMLRQRAVLYDYVAAGYARAIGLLKLFGFTVHAPQPYGRTGAPFCKFELRRAAAQPLAAEAA